MAKVWWLRRTARAAEVGAEILRKGGNAIDAAVATGMAIGAVEPWMSGIGGVGFMTIWSAKEGRAWTIDYGPISARKLDPTNYPDRRPRPGQSLRLARHPRAEERGRLSLDRRARPGRRHGQGARALRHAQVAGRDGACRRARRARHGARLVHAGDDRQRRRAPLEVPGVQGQLPARRRPRADHRLASQRALPQARQSRRDLRSGWPTAARANTTKARWRATSPPTCRPAARRSTTTISAPTRRASSSRCRSSMAAPPSTSRAASPPARRSGARSSWRARGTKGKGAPGADFFVAIAEGMHTAYEERLKTHGRQAHQHLHHAFLRRRLRRQHGGADPDADVAVRLLRDAAQDRHHHEQRHAVVRSRAQPAQLDRAGQAAAVQHLPRRRDQGRQAVVLHRRLGRPAHRAGGDAALADADRPRPRRGRRPSTSRASTSRASVRSASTATCPTR